VERKRLAGLSELARSGGGIEEGLYSREASVGVYRHLLQCAHHVLEGGYTAIVDATFQHRADRAYFHALSVQLGIPVCMVHCHAPRQALESRIRERSQGREDASEADLSVLCWQEAHFEPIEADEQIPVVEAMTVKADVVADTACQIGLRIGAFL
jgi:predicted kinase